MATPGFTKDEQHITLADEDLAPLLSGVGLYSRAAIRAAVENGLTLTADEAYMSRYAVRFAWAETAIMTLLDTPNAPWAEVKNLHYRATDDGVPGDDDVPQFTRDQVSMAVNNGIDLAAVRERRSVADDVDNFIVNAAMTLLDDPAADFYKVVVENYCDSPSVIRSWLR
ncbi:hypothetical protein ACFV98_02575 [Streptomyces violascens]|uniref:hypothetical protein n=1 Tax=Streptomyces violascens TaxID=67381 RepID=UPI003667333C